MQDVIKNRQALGSHTFAQQTWPSIRAQCHGNPRGQHLPPGMSRSVPVRMLEECAGPGTIDDRGSRGLQKRDMPGFDVVQVHCQTMRPWQVLNESIQRMKTICGTGPRLGSHSGDQIREDSGLLPAPFQFLERLGKMRGHWNTTRMSESVEIGRG